MPSAVGRIPETHGICSIANFPFHDLYNNLRRVVFQNPVIITALVSLLLSLLAHRHVASFKCYRHPDSTGMVRHIAQCREQQLCAAA